MPNLGSDSLATISQDGKIPVCRMQDARQVQDMVRRLIENDQKRSWKRARVNGLVDGNPPYKMSKLREAGRADACNVNWGTGRSYLESGSGSFYDLSTEAPSMVTFRTSHGTPDQREEWSNIASAEADLIFKEDKVWDFQMQISQWDMVLHGCGPFLFEDSQQVFPRAFLCGDLKVPEFTKSDTHYWELCSIDATYYPPELYKFVQDSTAATAVGWDVEYTKRVIANAMDIRQQAGVQYQWETYQAEIKNNSLSYYDDSKVCRVAHVFWREFDGRITHAIVERETSVGVKATKANDDKDKDIAFLFKRIGRYSSWQEAIHPMYFDHGNGGYHHSVTGLGVKMYSAMEYENRLICNLCDKAFSPKILFKPTSTESSQKFALAHFGDYAVLPPNFEWQQTGLAGLMNDGIAMRGELTNIMQNTLSSYRQGVSSEKSGNPVTKFEKQMEAAMQSALSKPQFNRYYKQMDMLIAEIWRRLSNPNTTDDRAKEFQKKCSDKGVPIEALNRVEYVGATRVVGQGSAFMRKQAIDSLFPIAGSLPEEGRYNLISDKIASEAGQGAVARYYPKKQKKDMADDQQAEAMQWVGLMKVGTAPVITSSQNPVTFAMIFMQAADQSLQSLQRGGSPLEVLQFIQICGVAIAAQLKRFAKDPTRKAVFDALESKWTQLAAMTDKLKQMAAKIQSAKQEQSQKTEQVLTDVQLKQLKTNADIKIKDVKTAHQMQQSDVKMKHKLALADASTASDITLNRMKATQK